MSAIGLPVLASNQKQYKYVVSILNDLVPKPFRKGIQLYRGGFDREEPATERVISGIVKEEVPDDFIINLHAPFITKTVLPEYNFTSEKVKSMVSKNISLAESINARSLTIHFNTLFYHPERLSDPSIPQIDFDLFKWKSKWDSYPFVKKEVIDVAYNILKEIAESTKIKISVENMPIPLIGDIHKYPMSLVYDPKLNTYESIIEFLEEFSNFKNIGLCFDAAHYKLVQVTLNPLVKEYGNNLNYGIMKSKGFLGLYPERFSLQPDINTVVKRLISKNVLFDLQVADAGKKWIKDLQLLEEGLPMYNNDFGKELLKMLKYTVENSPDTFVSFDIEERDYLNRQNQINSLKMFFNYLSSKNL